MKGKGRLRPASSSGNPLGLGSGQGLRASGSKGGYSRLEEDREDDINDD